MRKQTDSSLTESRSPLSSLPSGSQRWLLCDRQSSPSPTGPFSYLPRCPSKTGSSVGKRFLIYLLQSQTFCTSEAYISTPVHTVPTHVHHAEAKWVFSDRDPLSFVFSVHHSPNPPSLSLSALLSSQNMDFCGATAAQEKVPHVPPSITDLVH